MFMACIILDSGENPTGASNAVPTDRLIFSCRETKMTARTSVLLSMLAVRSVAKVAPPDVQACIERALRTAPSQPLSRTVELCAGDPTIACYEQNTTLLRLFGPRSVCAPPRRRLQAQLRDDGVARDLAAMTRERESLMALLGMVPSPPGPPDSPPPPVPFPPPADGDESDGLVFDNAAQLALLCTLGGGMCGLGCLLASCRYCYLRYARSKLVGPSAGTPPRR
jgi:hypothetical protein